MRRDGAYFSVPESFLLAVSSKSTCAVAYTFKVGGCAFIIQSTVSQYLWLFPCLGYWEYVNESGSAEVSLKNGFPLLYVPESGTAGAHGSVD